MELPISTLAIVLIMIVIKGLVDGLLRPLVEAKGWDTNILRYAAWVLGIILVILAYVLPEQLFMLILLSLAVGCGSNILQEFLSAFGSKLATTYTIATTTSKTPAGTTETVTASTVSTKLPMPDVPTPGAANTTSEYIAEGKS